MCIILCFLIFSLFLAVRASKRNGANSTTRVSITRLFPTATLHGTISPELSKIWEMRRHTFERPGESQSPPLYEKVLFL
jgi:condensin-2 complex subunit H2